MSLTFHVSFQVCYFDKWHFIPSQIYSWYIKVCY